MDHTRGKERRNLQDAQHGSTDAGLENTRGRRKRGCVAKFNSRSRQAAAPGNPQGNTSSEPSDAHTGVNSSRDESPIDADNGHRRSSERDASDSLQEESHSVQFYFFLANIFA
jgi:hypothetical protein